MALIAASSGCYLLPGRTGHLDVPLDVPREQKKVSLPDYIIEPPDILRIDAISLTPKVPYRLGVFDVVSVAATGLPIEDTIDGQYTIQPAGTIQLGHAVGAVQAAGLTSEQLQQVILQRLRGIYTNPNVWVTLLQLGAQEQITGQHLVAPDGKVNLGSYGRVRVVGLTIEEAQATVQAHLSQYLQDPKISLDVLGYNSKVYYVVTQGAGLGDQVIILPARGNETVLDAIGQIQGLQSNSSSRMWIARPGANDMGGDQILPVDWLAVTQRGDITTNYQILPGDRLYVAEDKLVALDTGLAKVISPIERVFGVTLLGTETVREIKFFNQRGFGNGVVVGP
jgi:polysaccharide export outer membrane protein